MASCLEDGEVFDTTEDAPETEYNNGYEVAEVQPRLPFDLRQKLILRKERFGLTVQLQQENMFKNRFRGFGGRRSRRGQRHQRSFDFKSKSNNLPRSSNLQDLRTKLIEIRRRKIEEEDRNEADLVITIENKRSGSDECRLEKSALPELEMPSFTMPVDEIDEFTPPEEHFSRKEDLELLHEQEEEVIKSRKEAVMSLGELSAVLSNYHRSLLTANQMEDYIKRLEKELSAAKKTRLEQVYHFKRINGTLFSGSKRRLSKRISDKYCKESRRQILLKHRNFQRFEPSPAIQDQTKENDNYPDERGGLNKYFIAFDNEAEPEEEETPRSSFDDCLTPRSPMQRGLKVYEVYKSPLFSLTEEEKKIIQDCKGKNDY